MKPEMIFGACGRCVPDAINRFTIRFITLVTLALATNAAAANAPPVLTAISNQTVNVEQVMATRIVATDPDVPPQSLQFTLVQHPPGATIHARATNAVVAWKPKSEDANTTNVFMVVVQDNGSPSLSATQIFQVVVTEFLQPGFGTLVVQAGEEGCLSIALDSSEPMTNISFAVRWPAGTFTSPVIYPLLPSFCSSSLQALSPTQWVVNLSVCPGQTLILTQRVDIAQLCLTAIPEQPSSVVPLVIPAVIITRPDGTLITNRSVGVGRTVVVGDECMLEAVFTPERQRQLFLYGRPGSIYQIESTTDLSNLVMWQLACRVPMTGPALLVCCTDLTGPTVFYRAFRYSAGPTNQPPIVDVGADQTIRTKGTTLTGTARDDGLPAACQMLTFAWTNLSGPGAVLFSSPTSAVTSVTFSQHGAYLLRLSVSDSQDTNSDDVKIVVRANGTPVIYSVPAVEVIVGHNYRYPVQATDPDQDQLRFWLQCSPAGMAIDSLSGVVTWTPQAANAGTHSVCLRVEDGHGGYAEQTYGLSVILPPPNRPPVFISLPVVDADVNSAYTYQATAVDPDEDTLTYRLITSPPRMTIAPSSGLVNWTPVGEDFLRYSSTTSTAPETTTFFGEDLNFTEDPRTEADDPARPASLPASNAARDAFLARLRSVRTEGFEQYPTGHLATALQFGSDTATITSGDPIVQEVRTATYGGTYPTSGTKFVLQQAGGESSFELEFSSPQAAFGFYATDLGEAAQLILTLHHPGGGTTDIMVPHTAQTDVSISGSAIFFGIIDTARPFIGITFSNTLSAVDGFGFDDMTIGRAENVVPGTANVVVLASDSRGGTATHSYLITVLPDPSNHPPVIISQPVASIIPNQAYVYDVDAIDPDNDALSYSLVQAPAGMRIDGTNGLIQWQPGSDYLATNAVRFFDGTFNTNDWEAFRFTNGSGGQVTFSNSPSGGNPAAYGHVQLTINKGRRGITSVLEFFKRKDATYDPAIAGAIFSIDYSEDFITFTADSFGQNIGIGIRQGGKVFAVSHTSPTVRSWTNFSRTNLTELDFHQVENNLLLHPDFSERGSLIEFGFIRNASCGDCETGTDDGGIDNWTVVVTPVATTEVSMAVADAQGGIATQQFTIATTRPAQLNGFQFHDLNTDGTWQRGPDLVVCGGELWRYHGKSGALINRTSGFATGALTLGPDGDIYALSFSNVLRFAGATSTFLGTFVTDARLRVSFGLTFGPDGNLYVTEQFERNVLKYNGINGEFVRVFAVLNNRFEPPVPAHLRFGSDGHLYVVDSKWPYGDAPIFKFHGQSGEVLANFGSDPAQQLNLPAGLEFGPDGNVYVCAWNSDNVVRFNGVTGNFIDEFVPRGRGGLDHASGLAFGPDGNLYVASRLNARILRYNGTNGAFLDAFIIGGPGFVPYHFLFTRDNSNGAPEPALPDWTLYLDQNRNGRRDPNERFTTTDQNGRYAFTDLSVGSYLVALELQTNWIPTAPAMQRHEILLTSGQVAYQIDFGVFATTNTLGNQSPKFTTLPPDLATLHRIFVYDAEALDPDGDPLTFDLVVKPAGMAVDPNAGVVVWIPQSTQIGVHDVFLRVRDGKGGLDLQTFRVTVSPDNTAPVITSIPPAPAIVNAPYQYAVQAQDAENDAVTFGLDSAPTGMVVNAASGVLTWRPSPAQLGTQYVALAASDGRGGSTTQFFDLLVVASSSNNPPMFVSSPRTSIGLGHTYFYAVQASDPDNDPLMFSLTHSPSGMTLTNSQLITWKPTPAQLGSNQIEVHVDDGRGGFATQTFFVNVGVQGSNQAPAISSIPPLTATVGSQYVYDLLGSDPDGDPFIWAFDQAPLGMSINPNLGTVRWTPSSAQRGSNFVSIRMVDFQGEFDTQTYVLNVYSVNLPPIITSTPPTEAGTNQLYTYAVRATDPDDDALLFSLTAAPTNMSINATNGLIEWIPNEAQFGTNEVSIRVEDGRGGVANQDYLVVVSTNANRAPVITSIPPLVATATVPYQYAVTAADPDGDSLTYALLSGPAGMSLDTTSGIVDWTPASAQSGVYSVTVVAIDRGGAAGSQTFAISVRQFNRAPVIASPPVPWVYGGSPYRYDVFADDPDGDPLTYAFTAAPAGMTITGSGAIFWSPGLTNMGTHPISIVVSDNRGASATQSYDLLVRSDTEAPVVSLFVSPNPAMVNSLVTCRVSASDDVRVQSLGLSIEASPIRLDARGGVTLRAKAVGQATLVASATDFAGNTGYFTNTLVVVGPDTEAPLIEIVSPANDAVITSFVNIVGTVSDANLLYYTLSVAPIDSTNFTEFARGSNNVVNGVLGRFDPSTLANDSYVLRLIASDGTRLSSIEQNLSVAGELKLGNFRLSFTDMTIPVSGIPITVTRTYDTLNASRQSDFGFGWRLEFRDVDLRSSVPKPDPEQEALGIFNPFRNGTRVYLTLPGGTRKGFTFQPEVNRLTQLLAPYGLEAEHWQYDPVFIPDAGVTSELALSGATTMIFDSAAGAYFTIGGTRTAFNPADDSFFATYELTTKDGIAYQIDAPNGKLRVVSDPNGNALTFSDAGITSSTGTRITFARDPQGRITSVTDPMGLAVRYQYDAQGDLVSVTDRETNTTRFVYHDTRAHYLINIIDPLGRSGVRTEYDDQGRLVGLVKAATNRVSLIHDSQNFVEEVVDSLGHTNTLEYDARGNIVSRVDAIGNISHRSYDEENNALTETDALGNTTSFAYDSRRNLISRTDALGKSTQWTYNELGKVVTITDPLGRTILNSYDTKGNLLTFRDASGAITGFEYDTRGNLTRRRGPNGSETVFTYSAAGQMTSFTDPEGVPTLMTNDTSDNLLADHHTLLTLSGPVNVDWGYQYDGNGRLLGIQGPDSSKAAIKVDAAGQTIASINPLGEIWTFEYDDTGRINARTASDGSAMRVEYDGNGNESAVIFPGGQRIERRFDALDRVVATTSPLGGIISQAYDATGRRTNITDQMGRTASYSYDKAGRLLKLERPGGATTSFVYDDAGQLAASVDAEGNTTYFERDDSGRGTKGTFPDGSSSSVAYDNSGRILIRTNLSGAVWRYSYSMGGHLESVIDPAGNTTTYSHDTHGIANRIRDSRGNSVELIFDTLGRLVQKTLPAGLTQSRIYNAGGQLISVSDFAGQLTQFRYDQRGRQTHRINPDGTDERHSYDSNNAVIAVEDFRGQTLLPRDANGRLKTFAGPSGFTVSYVYNLAAQVQSVSTDSGTSTFSYNDRGELADVQDNQGRLTRYTRDRLGRTIKTMLPTGCTLDRTYDSVGRTARITYSSSNSTVLYDLSYTRDSAGRIIAQHESSGWNVEYQYDVMDRLIQERLIEPDGTRHTNTFAYDSKGNRTEFTAGSDRRLATYDANDRLLSDGRWSYTWDPNGNLALRANGGTTERFAYDSQNRLVRMERDGLSPITVEYSYDFDGLLASRAVNGVTNSFLWDRVGPGFAQLLEERDATGMLLARYDRNDDSISQMQMQDGSTFYFISDHLGTVRGVVNTDGTLKSTLRFDAYGALRAGTLEGHVGFGNGFTDRDTGLIFFRSRWYSPEMARFIQPDSVDGNPVYPSTLNLYTYAENDPINHYDPLGQFSLSDLSLSLSVAGILASLAISHYPPAQEWIIRNLTFGRFTWDNFSAFVYPILSGTAQSSFFLTANVGFEVLFFQNATAGGTAAAYAYLGVGAALPRGRSASLSLNLAQGYVFDTRTPADYRGWFGSITVSGAIAAKSSLYSFPREHTIPVSPLQMVFGSSAGFSLFFSPSKTYDDPKTGEARFSHGITPISLSFNFGNGLSQGFSIGVAYTFYLQLAEYQAGAGLNYTPPPDKLNDYVLGWDWK